MSDREYCWARAEWTISRWQLKTAGLNLMTNTGQSHAILQYLMKHSVRKKLRQILPSATGLSILRIAS